MDCGGGWPLYYTVLGVRIDASDQEIRRAYRKLAMQWHPDKWAKTPSLLGEAKQKFQQIQEAYSVLSDRSKRMMYDAGLYSRDGDEEDTEGKEISSPPPSRGVKGESEKNEGREAEVKSSIDDAFDINIFKNIEKGGDNKSRNAHSPNEPEIIDVDDLEQTRKRKCLFEDHDDKPTGRKRLVVLGDDSKPVRRSIRKSFTSEEQRPLFNIEKRFVKDENGGGWWTEHMAGVDNEEVGCNDVWEGVGCTTLGGLEWH